MKTKNLIELLKKGNISIPKYLLSEYKKIGLSSEEFIFLIGLIGIGEEFEYNPEELKKLYNINLDEVLGFINALTEKGLIETKVVKNKQNKYNEYISLANFYEKLANIVSENITQGSESNNVFAIFEKEFGRTLSPMEYEIISKWFEENMTEEIVVEALKEATFNGVSNLRYIDKILREWSKKGIKTKEDIKEDYKKFKNKTKESGKEVFEYDWLEDEE